MGLTIHYTLNVSARTPRQASRLVNQLRQAASDLPFDEVGPLIDFTASPGQEDDYPAGLFHATPFVSRGDRWKQLQPKQLFAFRIHPAAGCETAEFGLGRYPRCPGWSWQAFCKTQYASAPHHGGPQNFLRCHCGLITLLDRAAALGFSVTVQDEGNYFSDRDIPALLREIGQWNEMIAGLGGSLKDALGEGVASPIFNYSNFEHLEARDHARRRKNH
jgi:hypothetical protein